MSPKVFVSGIESRKDECDTFSHAHSSFQHCQLRTFVQILIKNRQKFELVTLILRVYKNIEAAKFLRSNWPKIQDLVLSCTKKFLVSLIHRQKKNCHKLCKVSIERSGNDFLLLVHLRQIWIRQGKVLFFIQSHHFPNFQKNKTRSIFYEITHFWNYA